MNWLAYKQTVAGSRNTIVVPFFMRWLAGVTGAGLDIGCGSGDLTYQVAMTTATEVVGVDSSDDLLVEARTQHPTIHFVQGDVEKNAIPTIGVRFDFAFSNCCFCHFSDEGVYNALMDLNGSLSDRGLFVMLVPSISWARTQYQEIRYVKSGITALPRFGGRQAFRTPAWYRSALTRCGFELVYEEDVLIPESEDLEERYKDHVGASLFTGFVVRKTDALPDLKMMENAFDVAHDNRKLEIELFWHRSLFFWGFVAAALIAYATVYDERPKLASVFAVFGLVCSIVWTAGNRGSKYWQEYWEEKVSFFQHYKTGNIFYDREPKVASFWDVFAPRRFSVSKLTMALSDYAVLLWFVLATHSLLRQFISVSEEQARWGGAAFVVLTLIYASFSIARSKSED